MQNWRVRGQMPACMQTHTKALLYVNINVAFGCWIIDTQTLVSVWLSTCPELIRTGDSTGAAHVLLSDGGPFLKHFSPVNQWATDFSWPPVCMHFSSRATVLVVLETHSKASFIETGLGNKALTHTICKCTHMQGGLNQGRPRWILGQETGFSRITPPPPHMNSLNIRRKKNSTQHIVPFPLWAPICGWLRNSKGVIRLSLYKHGARKKDGKEKWNRSSEKLEQ